MLRRIVQVQRYRVKASGHGWSLRVAHQIAPGKHLLDVDFDWTENNALTMARRIFPDTGFGFGRKSRPLSHAFYTTSEPQVSKVYSDIDGTVLVEPRGAKQDGDIGLQTMIPPSIHPEGEEVVLLKDGEITHDDTIPRKVLLHAIACILLKNLGPRGLLHDTRLAVAGFLLKEGMTEDEAITIGEAVAEAYDFSAPTRFDKLFTGIVIGPADRPSFIDDTDQSGKGGIGPEDTGEADFERLLEGAQKTTRKYWRARQDSNLRPPA